MQLRNPLTVLAIGAATAFTILLGATPASAATDKNGEVEYGELGLYYLPLYEGGGYVLDLYFPDPNFADNVFPHTSVSANNNTEGWWNNDTYWWHVFTGANYTGSHGCLPPDANGNFSPTFKNTITSAYFSSSSC